MPFIEPSRTIDLEAYPAAHGIPNKVVARDGSFSNTIVLTQSAEQKAASGDKLMKVELHASPTISGSPEVSELRRVASANNLSGLLEANNFEK